MSIKQRVLLSFLAIALVIGLLGGLEFYHDIEKAETLATREAIGIAETLSMFVVLEHQKNSEPIDGPKNRRELQATVEQFKNVRHGDVVIVDLSKRIIAHAIPAEAGTVFNHDHNDEVGQTLRDGKTRLFTGKRTASPMELKQLVIPIKLNTGKVVGAVILEYTPLYNEIMAGITIAAWKFLLLYGAALLFSLIVGYYVARHISRPLLALKQAAIAVSEGNLDTRVDHRWTDELGLLADSFNTMTERMKQSHDSLLRSNEKLETEGVIRKMSAKALLESEQNLWTLFEFATDAFFILDLKGNFIDANRTAYERLGYSKQELLSMHVSRLDPPEFASKVPERMALLARQGWAVFEAAHIMKDGTVMPVEVNARITDRGENKVVFSIVRDITERKRTDEELRRHREELTSLVDERTGELKKTNEKLLAEITRRERMETELLKAQKIESLGVLAGGIAHDFNNLLTAVMGNVSLALLDLDEGHQAHKLLIGADRALHRAQELTQQLLTFSKGGAPVKRATVIDDLLRESTGFALRGSRTRCEFSFPENLWFVDVDEGQISQVIHNLAINADQAMPEGGTIMVRCENVVLAEDAVLHLPPGRYVRITIKDSGIGIPRHHIEKIFDPYFTTKQRGSGLGLATAYSIMQKHGGHIAVASEVGAGSTFILYLPASSNTSVKMKLEEEKPLSTGIGTILIMDDEESIRQSTGDALARFGYTAAFAESGARAIEIYQQAMDAGKPFDAVIMDLTIPGGMGGRETLQCLLKIDPAVKAIVSSGYSNNPVMAEYRSYGFAGVMAKPYRIRDLIKAVSLLVSGNRSEQGAGTAVPGK